MDSKITSIYDFSDKGLVELKNWLEPWFRNRAGNGGGTFGANHDLVAVFDGIGTVLTTGVKGDVRIDFACTIVGWTLLADQVGSIVIDVWKDTYANYPPTVSDTITSASKPTLSTQNKNADTTLAGWTTSIAAGDTIRYNIDSASTVMRAVLILQLQEI